jgi:hypothetical protein
MLLPFIRMLPFGLLEFWPDTINGNCYGHI